MVSNRAKQVINSLKPNLTPAPPGPTEKGSAGYDNIRDDIEKTKSLREGTMQKIPVDAKDIVNKEYVDNLPDVTAAVNLTANTIVQGDDGAKGIKTSTATVAQIAANVAHAADNTQAHTDYLLNNADDTTSHKITATGGFNTDSTGVYNAGGVAGITKIVVVKDFNGVNQTFTFKDGILTAQSAGH